MKVLKLKRSMQISTSDLWHHYRKYADVRGNEHLVFLPHDGKHKGKIALVVHADTYHETPYTYKYEGQTRIITPKSVRDKSVYFDPVHGVYWSPDGLGADDRAGVYAAFTLFAKLHGTDAQPVVILTDGEESGGSGAAEAAWKSHFLRECAYLIELDRRGTNDSVYYNDEPQDFRKHIAQYGFRSTIGSFSDISILAPSWSLCAVNLSVGFFDEHSRTEILHQWSLFKTISKVNQILHDHAKNPKHFEANLEFRTTTTGTHGNSIYENIHYEGDDENDYRFADNKYDNDNPHVLKCEKCGVISSVARIATVTGDTGYPQCPNCENLMHEVDNRLQKYGGFEQYMVRCKNCEREIDLAVHWDADCPYCATPLSL